MKATFCMQFIAFIAYLFSFFSGSALFAQDFNNYKVLRAVGKLPDDFTKTSYEKYEEQKKQNTTNGQDKVVQKDADKFYLKSSFGISDLLVSGRVLFGDPATIYLNKVADVLLASNPVLRKQLKFYVVKSAAVNAFATNDGVICVNLGLFARLENEAQLAYILGHEITHYVKKHPIEGYIYAQNIQKGRKDFKEKDLYEKRLANSNYSKEKEIEADKQGFELYSQTKYDLNEVINSFEVLKDATKPYQNLVFDNKILDNNYLSFPEKYFEADTLIKVVEDTTADAKKEAEEAELFSSHPAPAERKAKIEEFIKKPAKGELYLVSKAEFEKVRTLARFDLCDMFIIRSHFVDAFYQALLLKKEYPNSKYIDICLAKSLYGIAKYQNFKQKIFVVLDYEHNDWKGKNWYYPFKEMNTKEINVLAASYLYEMSKKYKDDVYLQRSLEDLLKDMYVKLDFTTQKTVAYSKTEETYKKEITANTRTYHYNIYYNRDKPKVDSAKNTKTDKDKEDKRRMGTAMKAVTDSAWSKLISEEAFAKIFDDKAEKMRIAIKNGISNFENNNNLRYQEENKKAKTGHRLGLDKVVILNPYAVRYDVTDEEDAKRYLETAAMQTKFSDYVKEVSEKMGLKTIMLNSKEFKKETDAQTLTQIALIKEWYAEQVYHDMVMVNSRQLEVEQLADELGTPHIALMGLISLKDEKKAVDYLKIFPAFYCPPLLHQAFRANEKTLIYTLVFDIKNEKLLMEEYNMMKFKTSEAVLKQNVYYHIFQIKKK
jgi:beta-barrel assembly-enhancing protease